VAEGLQSWSPEFLAGKQAEDPDISPAMDWVAAGQRPPWQEVRSNSPSLCALWRQFESLVFRDGVLCRIFHKTDASLEFCQVILPASLRASFLDLIHGDTAGHLRLAKSAEHI